MTNAYDHVDWEFLLHVLASFGFSSQVCGLIKACISSLWYSIVMYDKARGFNQGEKGVCQGDPLSTSLFIILQEVLSCLINQSSLERWIGHFTQPRNTPLVSHLMYANDVVIFANGAKKSLWCLMRVLHTYEDWSRKQVSKEKKAIYFSKQVKVERKRDAMRLMGCSKGTFHLNTWEFLLLLVG